MISSALVGGVAGALVLAAIGHRVGGLLGAWAARGAYRRPGDVPRLTGRPRWVQPVCLLAPAAQWWVLAVRGRPALGLVAAALTWLLVALAMVDLDVHRLPDALTLPAYPVLAAALGLVAATTGDTAALRRSVMGAGVVLVVGCVLWVIAPRHGLGLGDVKLAGLLAAVLAQLGWGQVLVGLWLGLAVAGVGALVLLVQGRATRTTHLALGPALSLGATLTLALG